MCVCAQWTAYPWVPTLVFRPKFFRKITPGGGKEEFKFFVKINGLKNLGSVVTAQVSQAGSQ